MNACPSCRFPMTSLGLAARLAGAVEIDLCFSCQGIWFDGSESTQISPGGIVELFKLIHDHRDHQRHPLGADLRCPRCEGRLVGSLDIVKSGRFNYHRCSNGHGRFVAFAQFMIEKGFVRQLNGAEIIALKARIGVVHCTSCGAPVDIRKDSACTYCQSPIAILDSQAVEKALASYHQAEVKRTTLDPEALADAILAAERERGGRHREAVAELELPIGDLIVSGIGMMSGLLKRF